MEVKQSMEVDRGFHTSDYVRTECGQLVLACCHAAKALVCSCRCGLQPLSCQQL